LTEATATEPFGPPLLNHERGARALRGTFMPIPLLLLALVFGFAAYRSSETFKARHEVTPWGWPSWAWGLIGLLSLLVWAVLFVIARKTTRTTSTDPVRPPEGWYPDPGHQHHFRYWDGAEWTDRVEDAGVAHVDAR
jgi:protein-S-isoprenylcysteine O-methyltransferase Ste14